MTATISRPSAISTTPPPGWEREVPKYRVGIAVYPSPNSRHRHEPPFTSCSNSAIWQFADRAYQRGEIVETREWPHANFHPLNFSAKKVLEFFNSRVKSRLQRAPWQGDRVHLTDGMGGTGSGPRPQVKTADVSAA